MEKQDRGIRTESDTMGEVAIPAWAYWGAQSQRAVEKIGGVRAGSRLDASGRESFLYRITASAFAMGLGKPAAPGAAADGGG